VLSRSFPVLSIYSTRVGGFCWEVMEDHGRSSGSGGEAAGKWGSGVAGVAGNQGVQ
nr:hypothetical protein [Tanacetum cinerariifolium]